MPEPDAISGVNDVEDSKCNAEAERDVRQYISSDCENVLMLRTS